MAYNEGLAERIRAHFGDVWDLTEKKMFGGLGFLKNGNYCVGVSGDSLMARIGPNGYAAALERPHVTPKMKELEQKMTGYVMVSSGRARRGRGVGRMARYVCCVCGYPAAEETP